MSRVIYNIIKADYEKKQKKAFDKQMDRKNEIYSKIPKIENIDNQIQVLGLKFNMMILKKSINFDKAVKELEENIDILKEEKKNILAQNKYPIKYLDLEYQCHKCKDTGYVEVDRKLEKCSCYKQELINHLYSYSNLKMTETSNFDCFNENYYSDINNCSDPMIKVSPRENILKIKASCMNFIENFNDLEEKNLFFFGPTGVGKTFMCNCVAREILNKGKTVLYQTAPKLFEIINEHKMRFGKNELFDDSAYNNIFETELLIIDDLGTETLSSSRYSELLNILNNRHINNCSKPCKIIISTNLGMKDLYKNYTERVASRIFGSFEIFKFEGEDIREIKRFNS